MKVFFHKEIMPYISFRTGQKNFLLLIFLSMFIFDLRDSRITVMASLDSDEPKNLSSLICLHCAFKK